MTAVLKAAELPNGVTLPYVEQGEPSGVPLLFFHAIADSWHSFERVLSELPDSIHAIVPTQRGHGDATRPTTGYRPRDFASDMLAFMEAVHVEAALLVGGSSGGFIARRMAMDYPERTLGLVLLGSPATLQGKPELLELWDSTLSKLTDPIDHDFVRGFAQSCIVQPVPAPFFETIVQENLKAPARVWKATFKGLLEDDSFQELGKVKAPTLVVWGDQDTIIPRGDQEALTAAIPNARLRVYRGAGHAFYWETPDRVADDLGACIAALGSQSDSTPFGPGPPEDRSAEQGRRMV